ncbi:hypothetical protein PFISCL1PPCAC_12285, partial [Pristionchus fissidentatus]
YNTSISLVTNVHLILKLADRFEFTRIMHKAVNFILASSLSNHTRLLLADQYNIGFLMEVVLPRYKSTTSIQNLKKTDEYEKLSEK